MIFTVKKSEKVRLMAMKKVQILKERFVVEPWDHKKWIPCSIYNQNHFISAKKIFFQSFQHHCFLQNVLFWQLHEKVLILKEQFFFADPWDQKNGFLTQFTIKIIIFWVKYFFQIFFFKNSENLWVFGKKKSQKERLFAVKKSKFWKNG